MRRPIDEHLGRVPLFADLSKKHLQVLSGLTTEASVRAGEVLLTEGHASQEFILIIDGEAELHRDGTVVGTHGPGDFVGEIALLADRPCTVSVVAATDLHIEVIERRSFRGMLADHPDIAKPLGKAMDARLAELEG